MSASRIVQFLGVCLLAAAAGAGCRSARTGAERESAIDFVVWPNANVARRASIGSFDVRGIDNDEHTRVGIGSGSARTLHVRVPAGAYAVAWTPAAESDTRAAAAALETVLLEEGRQEWPQIIVVSDGGPTTIDVHLAPHGSRTEPRLELASVGPGLN
jgi:hypothetical protein